MEDASNFADVFARRRRSLYALALQRLGVVEDAEDAVQETYVKCLGVPWQSVQCPDAMLTTIHLNVIRDLIRRRTRSPVSIELAPDTAESAPCPAIEALPPVCRRIFLLCKIEPPRVCRRPFGLSYAAMGFWSSMA